MQHCNKNKNYIHNGICNKALTFIIVLTAEELFKFHASPTKLSNIIRRVTTSNYLTVTKVGILCLNNVSQRN